MTTYLGRSSVENRVRYSRFSLKVDMVTTKITANICKKNPVKNSQLKSGHLNRCSIDRVEMPYLVRENLFIGNIGDAAEILQNGSNEITHILSVLSSASISFFSEWRSGLTIPTKEIRKVHVRDSGSEDGSGNGSKSSLSPDKLLYSLEYAGKDLKYVRMAVPLRDMESEDLLDYLDVCLDFIEDSRKEGSVLVHCFAGVSRRYRLYIDSFKISVCNISTFVRSIYALLKL